MKRHFLVTWENTLATMLNVNSTVNSIYLNKCIKICTEKTEKEIY